MTQALHLINGKGIADRLADPNGRRRQLVQTPKITDEQFIEELYLAVLCRLPTPRTSVELMHEALRRQPRQRLEAAQDVMWVLVQHQGISVQPLTIASQLQPAVSCRTPLDRSLLTLTAAPEEFYSPCCVPRFCFCVLCAAVGLLPGAAASARPRRPTARPSGPAQGPVSFINDVAPDPQGELLRLPRGQEPPRASST